MATLPVLTYLVRAIFPFQLPSDSDVSERSVSLFSHGLENCHMLTDGPRCTVGTLTPAHELEDVMYE